MQATQRDLPRPDDAFALLRHHTDRAVGILAGRPIVGPPFGAMTPAALAEVRRLTPLLEVSAFDAHLQLGLTSPASARRDLSWRLLELPA